jgi:hypothetical protein
MQRLQLCVDDWPYHLPSSNDCTTMLPHVSRGGPCKQPKNTTPNGVPR